MKIVCNCGRSYEVEDVNGGPRMIRALTCHCGKTLAFWGPKVDERGQGALLPGQLPLIQDENQGAKQRKLF